MKHRLFFGFAGAPVAFAVAVVYYFIVPEEVYRVSAFQKIILTYGHSLCWILLSLAILLWGMNKARKWSAFFAYTALGIYIVFISTLLIEKLF